MSAFHLLIALRYVGSRRGRFFVSLISAASLGGLALGVIALTVVVSVMNGFDSELKRRILGVVPHVVADNLSVEEARTILAGDSRVRGMAPFAAREGLLVAEGRTRLVTIHGIEPALDASVSIIGDHMVEGELADLGEGKNLVVGRRLAFALGLAPGDAVTLVFPRLDGGRVSPDVVTATVVGLFQLDSELDYVLGLMHVSHLGVSAGTRVALTNLFDAPEVAARLAQGHQGGVTDWTKKYGDFFRTVRMEKIMMFVLLTMIVAIAAFNIVSSLSILVDEKRADIAALMTMGATPADVRMVFICAGGFIGLAGTLIGVLLGIPLAYNVTAVVGAMESLTGGSMLAGTYFDQVPSDVRWPDIGIVVAVVLLISVAATIHPARKASRINPAEVLRYE